MTNTSLRAYVRSLLILCVGLFVCLMTDTSLASPVTNNISVKLEPSGSYATSLAGISNSGSEVTFRMQVLTSGGGGTGTYFLGFPSGLAHTYVGSNIRSNTCLGYTVLDPSSGEISFAELASGFCVVDVEFSYTIGISTPTSTYTVDFMRSDGTSVANLASVDIGVTAANTVTKAEALDMNNDGYMDTIRLTFGAPVIASTFGTGGLLVGSVVPSYSGSYRDGAVQYLRIPDDVSTSGDAQQLTVTDAGPIFAGV